MHICYIIYSYLEFQLYTHHFIFSVALCLKFFKVGKRKILCDLYVYYYLMLKYYAIILSSASLVREDDF